MTDYRDTGLYTVGFGDGVDEMEIVAIKTVALWFRDREPITTNQQLGDYVESLNGISG